MNAPQIIYLLWFLAGLLIIANKHGKDKEGKYSIWAALVSLGIQIWLLTWGEFFKW